ncbi:hypothetical protein D3C80_2183230 [compost metagenome]
MEMHATGEVISTADELFIGEKNKVVTQHAHLLLEGVQHLHKKRMRNFHVKLTGKNNTD